MTDPGRPATPAPDPVVMTVRSPTREERLALEEAVRQLAWTWARTLADLGYEGRPYSTADGGLSPEVARAAYAARSHAAGLLAAAAAQQARDDLVDLDTPAGDADGGWTREQVLAWLTEQGAPLRANTWSGYVTRGQAPAPTRRVGRTPLWDPGAVRTWHTNRPGRGWRGRDQPE